MGHTCTIHCLSEFYIGLGILFLVVFVVCFVIIIILFAKSDNSTIQEDQKSSTEVTCNLRPEGIRKTRKRIGNQKKRQEEKNSGKRKMLKTSSEGRNHQNAK